MAETDLSDRPKTSDPAPVLTDLRELFEASPPFATVVLDARSDVPDAPHRLEVRWRNARRRLEERRVDAATLDALEAAVRDPGCECGPAFAAVANPDGILLCGPMPAQLDQDIVEAGELPRLGPILQAAQSIVPHVLVLADRAGADIIATGADQQLIDLTVEGDEEHIHRGQPGGWAQRRFQQRAENTWDQNAERVADVVAKVSARIEARLIIVAGDERAVGFLRERLPTPLQERLREVEGGGRGPGASMSEVEDAARRLLATEVADAKVERLRTFKEERGQGDRAADGPARTLEALRQGQVETLLVHDAPDDERRAWIGPELVHVALDRAELSAMGVDQPREARLVDAAIRAAVGNGAEIRFVPGAGASTPTDGLGAILRFTVTPERP